MKLFLKATTVGIFVYRGERPRNGKVYSSDPGDLGRGIYYTTSWHRARSYATSDALVKKSLVRFCNPLILTIAQAYDLSDQFHTVRLPDDELERIRLPAARDAKLIENAERLTQHLLSQGHDGLISIDRNHQLEVVDYRPYR